MKSKNFHFLNPLLEKVRDTELRQKILDVSGFNRIDPEW